MDLFAVADNESTKDRIISIDLDRISPNPFQPRKDFAEDKIVELAQSIKACGLIQPIVVRRVGREHQLVVGERRLLACRKLGWKKISAAVTDLSDDAMATVALIENLQRENLNFMEEAIGYVRVMERFNLTQEVLAQRLGKSQSAIANKIRLLKLPVAVQREIVVHSLTERHARALLKLDSEEKQSSMVKEIVDKGLTVNQTEQWIDRIAVKESERKEKRTPKPIIRDMRIVLNTIRSAVAMIQKSGLYPEVKETVETDYIEVVIRLTRTTQETQKKNRERT